MPQLRERVDGARVAGGVVVVARRSAGEADAWRHETPPVVGCGRDLDISSSHSSRPINPDGFYLDLAIRL